VCERERERERESVSSLFVVFPLIGANIMFSTDFHRIGCIMFSVDFLELGGFRQIDFVQQKVSRRKKKKKKKKNSGKDLGRFGIQRIKLIQLSSDHACKVLGV
jgi:hypothetical protein